MRKPVKRARNLPLRGGSDPKIHGEPEPREELLEDIHDELHMVKQLLQLVERITNSTISPAWDTGGCTTASIAEPSQPSRP